MELNDNEFDAAFRKKVFDADPEFEEEAWSKMEQKLKKRDRFVLFKKLSVACVLLLAMIGSYYVLERDHVQKMDTAANNKKNNENAPVKAKNAAPVTAKNTVPVIAKNTVIVIRHPDTRAIAEELNAQTILKNTHYSSSNNLPPLILTHHLINPSFNSPEMTAIPYNSALTSISTTTVARQKHTLPLSLALSAGPEFNSASSIVGGKTGFSAGFTFGVGVSPKLSLQTGIKYSIKDYSANGYSYRLNKPNAKNLVANIDAACSVLEIPFQTSYTIANNQKRSIELNGGISSYLMLKEDYTFRYTPESGRKDYLLKKRNENQHFLSVVDVSATYFIKLKNDHLKMGIEPFMKIPLTGVGEGRVNLKSNGISLKLRYDLDKKNN